MSANPMALAAAKVLKAQLQSQCPGRIQEMRLFGSMARGDAGEESDIDVLVLVDRDDVALYNTIVDSAVSISEGLDPWHRLSAIVMEASRFAELQRRELLFAEEVNRDGILL
ncbi:MAG TPA: nucleotidyltransferase domain-containing protein [Candidatus Xenobia bacterium]